MVYLRRIANVLLIPIVLLAFVGLSPVIANATAATTGTPNGFTVSPVITEITVDKGQSQVVDVTVTNPASGVLVASPIVNDFVANSNESGTPDVILKPGSKLPTNNFISLVQPLNPVTLTGHAQAIIPVTISVPQNAVSGGYYGVIRFVPGNISKTGNVGLDASVGSLVIVTVPGNLTEKLSIIQLSTAKDGVLGSLFFSGNLSVVTRIQNDGNIQSAPFGNVVVKNSSNKIVTSFQLNEETPRGLVLPDSIRKFTNNLNYSNWFGHYTVVASLGYGNGGNLISASTSFWYIPIWSIVVAVIIIVLIVTIIFWIVNKGKDRKFSR